MRAVIFHAPGRPLELAKVPEPEPGKWELLLEVLACGVCRTDLHIVDGELAEPVTPLILGHQIVGRVLALGEGVREFAIGDRVGVPWLGGSCRACRYCETGRENLCADARYTGYQRDGGFAERCTADARYVFPLPEEFSDEEAAPLLCAGLIGFRAYRMVGDAHRLGLYGFGAAAHLLAQLARHEGRQVYAFTRAGDTAAQRFALTLGAVWAGSSDDSPPAELDAAILFAPAGELVPAALGALARGGVVVCAGIHMSDIPSFPYRLLWGERVLRSVANLTRRDGVEFFERIRAVSLRPQTTRYPLSDVARALEDLRNGRLQGSAVVIP
jgi:propanol-preferring alcohol dehydrogenase